MGIFGVGVLSSPVRHLITVFLPVLQAERFEHRARVQAAGAWGRGCRGCGAVRR